MNNLSVIIVGGGLVGSLCACTLAQLGFRVDLYEQREDIKKSLKNEGRSINLSLSSRGLKGLKSVGLEDDVLKMATPMKGRLIHNHDGKTKSMLYDEKNGQCIYSVERNFLNKYLLSAAEDYQNIKIYFNHKLIDCKIDIGEATFLNMETKETLKVKADLIIGADGAFSTVRSIMQKSPLFNFSQTYIDHGYLELSIPPENSTKMIPNHLHIWPRGTFMMIALPNCDGSWTVTLFMPFDNFAKLQKPQDVLNFFREVFPDSLPLLTEKLLIEAFFKKKPSYLVSIKCSPYDACGKVLLIGDAAHAMVPFYGQGMNAGFEDCYLLSEMIKSSDSLGACLRKFTEMRNEDGHAICELAMYNYVEMRDLVTKNTFYIRKKMDHFLSIILPNLWMPLYKSVTFSDLKYKECLANRQWQDKVIRNFLTLIAACLAVALFLVLGYFLRS